jgi:hypothetical protein
MFKRGVGLKGGNMFGKKNLILKSVSIVTLGTLLMANQKCQQAPAPEARQLKKNIKVIGMQASSFMDASGFNFSEVAQNQLSGVFFESNHFFERNVYPNANVNPRTSMGIQKTSASDQSNIQIKNWFPSMKSSEIQLTRESACLISRPQHYLSGKINSLEAYSGGSLQVGFNSSVQIPVSANFKMDKMRMDLSMQAFDPWTMQNMASVNSEVFKKDYAVGFGIDLGVFHLGPQFYRQTGMAETVLKGLRTAVADISKLLNSLQRQEWQSRVMLSRDNYVVIVGGAELGLKKGDRLKIENEVHDWMGEACGETGILVGSTVVTNAPWIVEIEDAGNLMSKAKVLNVDENQSIEVGALVRVDKLVADVPAAAAKK